MSPVTTTKWLVGLNLTLLALVTVLLLSGFARC